MVGTPTGSLDDSESHYNDVHAPLAAADPHLTELVTPRSADGFAGGTPAFYRVAESIQTRISSRS